MSLQELRQLSRPCVDFLKAVLERDPNKRLSAEQALEHPWIADASGAADLPLGGSVVQVGWVVDREVGCENALDVCGSDATDLPLGQQCAAGG